MAPLRYGVMTSFALCLILLTWQTVQIRSFGRRRPLSRPRGNPQRGILYALGRGMLPWEKESAARHLPTSIGGVLYHLGIFVAILSSLATALQPRLQMPVLPVVQVLLAAGFLAGMGLLVKRATKPQLRFISCPDDYIANVLVDILLLTGLLATWLSAAQPLFLLVAILTYLYMPLGKIRHCFFFFFSRVFFGSYFARRGVLPPGNQVRIQDKT